MRVAMHGKSGTWKTLLVVMLVLFFAKIGFGQTASEVTVEPSPVGARAGALGDAYAGDPYDVMSMYANPASLAFLRHPSVVVNSELQHGSQYLDNYVAFPVLIGQDMVAAAGINGGYFGQLWHSLYFAHHGIDAGWAVKLSSSLSVGGLLNAQYGVTADAQMLATSGSLGMLYFPEPEISYGLALRGFGWGMTFAQNETGASLDYKKDIPRILEMGVTWRYPAMYDQPVVIMSFATGKIFGSTNLSRNAGIEIYPFRFVALRFGVSVQPSQATERFGVGINLAGFRLDYALLPGTSGARFHQLSISIPLENS